MSRPLTKAENAHPRTGSLPYSANVLNLPWPLDLSPAYLTAQEPSHQTERTCNKQLVPPKPVPIRNRTRAQKGSIGISPSDQSAAAEQWPQSMSCASDTSVWPSSAVNLSKIAPLMRFLRWIA